MALSEGIIMSVEEINTFIHPFKPDIRQSTLQLQYVLSTGEMDQVILIIIKYLNCNKLFLYSFIQKTLNNAYVRSINSVWWNWPYIIGCDTASIENGEQTEGNVNMETISQKLDSMSNLNLIYSKTQVCRMVQIYIFELWYVVY